MSPHEYLINESLSLLSRLEQTRPFTMSMPMVSAASISDKALTAIHQLLADGKATLRNTIHRFILKAQHAPSSPGKLIALQREFVTMKLRFNSILDQVDIFADVLSQRSEHETGIWLAGLDRLAEDALSCTRVRCKEYPALMVFLERGHGAAIRKARTRLPGGDENPAAVIQVPRERMIGCGIASSIAHEVGHQLAELAGLTNALKLLLQQKARHNPSVAWQLFERWISEIIADYWAVGLLGVTATSGLMNVVTLPEYFQFRIDTDDPHPAPIVRVKLSAAFGASLYPDRQWQQLWNVWERFYPTAHISSAVRETLRVIDEAMPEFISLVNAFHVPGTTLPLRSVFPRGRDVTSLQSRFREWRRNPALMDSASPTLLFAALGQAKNDQLINAREEFRLLSYHLSRWAYNRKISTN